MPALDGVRALAVVAVLCFHGGMSWLPGGFLGVDAFFVLSGYLITTLLLTEWQRTGHVDLLAFWGRRARRLLPALFAVVAAVGLALAGLAVVVVIAHVALVPNGFVAGILAVQPLPALGLISYGVYLWHWPIFIAVNAGRTGLEGASLFGARCLVTVLVATASYILLERPIRQGLLLRRAMLAVPAAVGAAVTCAVLIASVTAVPSSAGSPTAASEAEGVGAGGLDALRGTLATAERPGPGEDLHEIDDLNVKRHMHRVRPGQRVVVDIFGDSVAWSMATALPHHPLLDLRDRSLLGCGVTLTAPYRYFGHVYETTWRSCRPWANLWRAAIARDDPDVALVLVGRWETMDRVLDGKWTHIGRPAFDAHLRERLRTAISIAGAHGAEVVLATNPFNRRGEQLDGGLFPEDRPERVIAWNRLLRDVAAGAGASVIDLGKRITPRGRFTWTAGGYVMRTDGLHLAPGGVRGWIAP